MCPVILPSVASLALQHSSTLSHKWHDFQKKNLLNIKCEFLSFSATLVRNISHSKKNSARYYHKFKRSSCKYPLFLSDLNKTSIFEIDF